MLVMPLRMLGNKQRTCPSMGQMPLSQKVCEKQDLWMWAGSTLTIVSHTPFKMYSRWEFCPGS